jgi:choline dehydrogenase-like flavoprotein
MAMVGRLYRDAGMVATATLPFIQIPHGRCVGGTTVVNCGSSFRLPAKYYRHLDGILDEAALAPAFAEIERLLEIAPAEPAVMARQNLLLQRGAEQLGYSGGPIPRNAPRCRGSGRCNIGCPSGAKLSMEASFVPWALEKGAELVHGLRADRLRPHARGVTVECARGVRVEAELAVVAAGTLHTPLLLRRSRLGGLSRHTGRNLTIHPSSGISGELDDPVELWKGMPQGYYVDHFAADGILFEGVGMTSDLAALSVPLAGAAHRAFMARLAHMASIGLMVSDEPVGSVREVLGLLAVSYQVTPAVLGRMRRAFVEGARMMLAAGAAKVHFAIHGFPPVSSVAELERRDFAAVGPKAIHWNAFHPLGTCRMGRTARDGATGADGRVFGQERILVCDGSVFPASTQVNPQLAIMANALRVARGLLA